MKRLLLSLFCLLTVSAICRAAEETVATLQFGSAYNSTKVSSYSNSWTSTVDGRTWEVVNFNNNNNGWAYVKCGPKNSTSTASITNTTVFTEPISKIAVTIDNITNGTISSLKLLVSSDNTFPEGKTQEYSFGTTAGTQSVDITSPISDGFYKIEFTCINNTEKTNGVAQVSKVEYFKSSGGVVISGLKPSYSVELDGTFDLAESLRVDPADATLSYTITGVSGASNDGLTVDGNVFTGVKVGTYRVDITGTADGLDSFSGFFKVDVTKKAAKLEFADSKVYGKLGVGVVWQPVTVVTPEDADARGKITYKSSDESIVVVDAETGQIWGNDNDYGMEPGVKAEGEAIITATMEATAEYAEATAEYKITIYDPATASVSEGTDIFDFTKKNYGILVTSDSGYQKGTAGTNEIDANKEDSLDVVSISFVTESGNGYRIWKPASGNNDLRIYTGTKMIFSVPDGYRISQIGMTGTSASGTFSPASNKDGHQDVVDWPTSYKNEWHSSTEDVQEVTFTLSSSPTKIEQIYVLYEGTDADLDPANISFNNVVYGIYENEPAKVNAITNPNNIEGATYSIQTLNDDEYTITPSADGKTLDVTISKPGAYTLEAKTPQTGTYRSGYAILRLNVYSHLPVYVNGDLDYYDDYICTAASEGETLYVTMDYPELTTVYYQLHDADGKLISEPSESTDEDINIEEGFTEYDAQIDIPANFDGSLTFYIAAYGYHSPKRTVVLSGKPNVEFDLTDKNGEEYTLTTYEGHDHKDVSSHTFTVKMPEGWYHISGEGTLKEDVTAALVPEFEPMTIDKIADYDKDGDKVKENVSYLLYEEPTVTIEGDQTLSVTAKHAGIYKLVFTTNDKTAKPGNKAATYVEITPNLGSIYMHGLNAVSDDNVISFADSNEKGHIHYIAVGHPTYGNNGQNGIWYQIEWPAAAAAQRRIMRAPSEDAWQPFDNENGIDLVNEAGQKASALHLKVASNGATTTQSYSVGDITTAVEGIEAVDGVEYIYIDMNGLRVAEPIEGEMYIRLGGGRAEKVVF